MLGERKVGGTRKRRLKKRTGEFRDRSPSEEVKRKKSPIPPPKKIARRREKREEAHPLSSDRRDRATWEREKLVGEEKRLTPRASNSSQGGGKNLRI